ncbi:hypothetical protein [Dialister succinatiphilus]|uniref:Uncharacterized protein n=1 Tax=Dialister succinatiphilus YIT 11850 TaxID=742743 RepID=H1D2S2_9FIRM|nr:hypothetical protein [Dialister succinatiphilus]EHO62192.1 hypothetical protein HMPREF9453_01910 [Dialister succinatiphilus YIT 11850]
MFILLPFALVAGFFLGELLCPFFVLFALGYLLSTPWHAFLTFLGF